MVSRARVNKYREVIPKQGQVQVCNVLKSLTETHGKVVRKIPRSMNDSVYSGLWCGVVRWEGVQIFNATESKWVTSTFVGYFMT